jgi:hypothetical protein
MTHHYLQHFTKFHSSVVFHSISPDKPIKKWRVKEVTKILFIILFKLYLYIDWINFNLNIMINQVYRYGYPYFHHNCAECGCLRFEIARKRTVFTRIIGHRILSVYAS